MKTLKLTCITFAICFLLLGVLNSSDAFEITYMYVYPDTDYGSGANATTYVDADEDIVCIRWFVDDIYSHTTHYGDNTRSAYETFRFTGDIKGNKHKITAEAWLDPDVCMPAVPKSYKFRVFKPKKIIGTKYPLGIPKNKRGTGVYGEVELYRHYHRYSEEEGHNIVVYGSAYARNGTKQSCDADVLFRHAEFDTEGNVVWKREYPPEGMPSPYESTLSPGDTYWIQGLQLSIIP